MDNKVHSCNFRGISQHTGSLGVQGHCLFRLVNLPEHNDGTVSPTHWARPSCSSARFMSLMGFLGQGHSKYGNFLYHRPFWLCQREPGLSASKAEARFNHQNHVLFALPVLLPPPSSRWGPVPRFQLLCYYHLLSHSVITVPFPRDQICAHTFYSHSLLISKSPDPSLIWGGWTVYFCHFA